MGREQSLRYLPRPCSPVAATITGKGSSGTTPFLRGYYSKCSYKNLAEKSAWRLLLGNDYANRYGGGGGGDEIDNNEWGQFVDLDVAGRVENCDDGDDCDEW